MTNERYNQLQYGQQPQQLTREEFEAGWHWCPEMDDLLCLLGSEDCFCAGGYNAIERAEACDSEDDS